MNATHTISDQKVPFRISIVMSLLIGVLVGIISPSIYQHNSSPSTNVKVVVQSGAKKWIANVSCSVNEIGQYTANGSVKVGAIDPPVLLRIDADFYGDGPSKQIPIMSAYTYFDTSDPAIDLSYAGIGAFSIVTLEAGNIPGSKPTSCRISATDSYDSNFHR